MDKFKEILANILDPINNVIWHDYVLYVVLGVGVPNHVVDGIEDVDKVSAC